MAVDFRDKCALVTGGARGIGKETARLLAERGAQVILGDVDREAADEFASELRATGASVSSYGVDVSDPRAVAQFARWVEGESGQVSLVVNCAGVLEVGGIEETSEEAWEHILGVNLHGVIHVCRAFAPGMRRQGEGQIVNVASAAGEVGFAPLLAYTTSKFGVIGFSRALRSEMAAYGVGVSVVCPGLVNTGIFEHDRFHGDLRDRLREVLARHGLPPQKVASAIVDAAERNRGLVTVGGQARALHWVNRISPGMAGKLLERAARSRLFQGNGGNGGSPRV